MGVIHHVDRRRVSETSGNGLLEVNKEQLKLLCGQFLFVITFVFNIATLVGVLWVIFKFGLSQNFSSLIKLSEDGPNKSLRFDQNIQVDTLGIQAGESLRACRIINEEIYLSTGRKWSEKDGKIQTATPVAISLSPSHISMQAESYGQSEHEDSRFRLVTPKRLEQLDIVSGLHNIRSVRPLQNLTGKNLGRNLDIKSGEQLELSGNRGVNVHSKGLELSSPSEINIESKEDAIIMQLNGGKLLLPLLPLLDSRLEYFPPESSSPRSLGDKRQLCIDKTNGLLYQAGSLGCK